MPPYAGAVPAMTSPLPAAVKKPSEPSVVTLNVGGQIFQTTRETLALSGPDSFLSTLSYSPVSPTFLDRDPDLFSILLSLLRTGRLPSKASSSASVDLQDLAAEARFYGLQHLLVTALSGAARFDPFGLRRSAVLPLNGRDAPSTVSVADEDGSVHVAHGSKVTTFDWSLRRRSTVLTCFPVVDSLLALGPSLAAAGADDFPGLRVLDLHHGGAVRTTLNWSYYPNGPGSTVQAIGASSHAANGLLFGSFESCRRNASAIVAFDLAGGTLRPVAEIGRREVYGAELDSAIPATKLTWVSGPSLLMAAGSHAGPSGLLGIVRLWDVRCSPADAPAWELKETNDCFADVTVSDSLNSIFKVGANSGDVFMADLRMLGGNGEEGPWVRLGDARRPLANGKGKEGSGCRIETYGRQVFCSRGGDVEMWSEVVTGYSGGWRGHDVLGTTMAAGDMKVMRRNVMGRANDAGGSRITKMGFGGRRMVLARKDQQSVEVWESSIKG